LQNAPVANGFALSAARSGGKIAQGTLIAWSGRNRRAIRK